MNRLPEKTGVAPVEGDELRELINHQEKIRENERKRIAREIHDELGQHLLALRIEISLLKQDVCNDAGERAKRIDEILSHIDLTVKSVRTLINDLRPAVLDLGLIASLEWQARDFSRANGVACVFHTDDDKLDLDAFVPNLQKPAAVQHAGGSPDGNATGGATGEAQAARQGAQAAGAEAAIRQEQAGLTEQAANGRAKSGMLQTEMVFVGFYNVTMSRCGVMF